MPTVVGGLLDMLARWTGTGLAPATFVDLVRALAQVGIVVVSAWVALTWRPGRRAEAVRAVTMVMGATILLSPVVHLWYFLWVVPFLAVIRLPQPGTTALLAGSVVGGLVAPLDSSLHGAYLAIVTGSLLVGAAVLVLLATRGARERLEKIATAEWLPVPRQPAPARVAAPD
jgi:alpha-1,6-mannosyltransferase